MSVEYGNKVGQVDVKLNKKYGGKVAHDFKNHTTQSELNYKKGKNAAGFTVTHIHHHDPNPSNNNSNAASRSTTPTQGH